MSAGARAFFFVFFCFPALATLARDPRVRPLAPTPRTQFYVAHLHHQPWVQGNYSGLLVQLSAVYSALRGDAAGTRNEDAAQGFVRSTTKYWVRTADVSAVKHHILQHLPVFQFSAGDGVDDGAGDAQLINSACVHGGGWRAGSRGRKEAQNRL